MYAVTELKIFGSGTDFHSDFHEITCLTINVSQSGVRKGETDSAEFPVRKLLYR